uniref:Helically-extended SH3 domain-containing protein n=1 Tax=Erpetoichthys calabaricus TaxID=27687 RepID=A0A8C4RXH8_ERPCA
MNFESFLLLLFEYILLYFFLQYEGEIKVLHQVTVISGLNNKKWANKELALKPSEVLDVIQKAVDNKFICRNEEGKCNGSFYYGIHPVPGHRLLEVLLGQSDVVQSGDYENLQHSLAAPKESIRAVPWDYRTQHAPQASE